MGKLSAFLYFLYYMHQFVLRSKFYFFCPFAQKKYLCTRKSINLEFDMKFLSCILALWVVLLSTLPCFLEDECLFQHTDDMQEDTCPNNNGTSCTDCCSPFLHCSTCTGFLIPKLIHSPFIRMVLLNDNLHSFYKERLIPQFSSAIWQPPKLINT